jgi:hypothetical protein
MRLTTDLAVARQTSVSVSLVYKAPGPLNSRGGCELSFHGSTHRDQDVRARASPVHSIMPATGLP